MEIKDIKYKQKFEPGFCDTCDYGSHYINKIQFEIDGNKIEIETNQMYEYTLTEAEYMRLLNESDTLDKFYTNMFDLIASKGSSIQQREVHEAMEMRINGEYIDLLQSCLYGRPIEKEMSNGKV